MVGIVLFGLISYHALPVSDLPAVDYPTINVNASLPGANPETWHLPLQPARASVLRNRRDRFDQLEQLSRFKLHHFAV